MRCRIFNFLFIFVIFILLIKTSFALGVTPAKVSGNFVPGFQEEINYQIYEENPNQEINIYVEGDLAEYMKVSKKKIKGGGSFDLKINLPESLDKPGHHKTYVVAEEAVEDNEVVGSIGTSVTMRVLVDIFVPYPGKYLEVRLKSENINFGENVDFEMDIESFGKEDVNVTPNIEIYEEPLDKLVDTLYFRNRKIESRQSFKLGKSWNSSAFYPGNYKAVAVVDYGVAIAKDNSEFKVGQLIINVLDYTKELFIGGLQAFNINIESGWNDRIDGAYAEVSFLNISNSSVDFKTSSESLEPWENKTIIGYLDTTNFEQGIHLANITVYYYGKSIGKSLSQMIEVKFIKERDYIKFVIIGILIILMILLIIFLIKRFYKKNGRKKRKKRK